MAALGNTRDRKGSVPRKQQKTSAASSSLVRNESDDEDNGPTTTAHGDVVTDEAERWEQLDKKTIREFRDDEGIVNEFALLYHVRSAFPLHFAVFKQTAFHLSHEGNSEQLFSRAQVRSRTPMARWTRRSWPSGPLSESTTLPTNQALSKFWSATYASSARAPQLLHFTMTTTWGSFSKTVIEGEEEDGDYYVQPSPGD